MDKLKTLSILALVGLGALIFFLRLHTYEEPLERDVTTYAVIAHEMLGGKALYSDLWDHKPPAIHVTYAAAELIAGYGRDSIFLMNIVAAIATLIACYFAGSAAGGGRLGGLVAAGLWALASGDLAIEGNQPNTEVFLNVFLTAGLAMFVRAEKTGFGLRGALVTGLFFAAASLYKQVVIAQAGLLAFAYCCLAEKGSRKKAIVDVAIIAMIGATVWGCVFGYFAARGRLGAFWESVFTYNHWYSGDIGQNLRHVTSWPQVAPDVLTVILSMAILSIVGLVIGLIFGPRRPWILFLSFAIGTHVAVLLPGRFFAHYYQLWLPLLAIGGGWTIAALKRILPVRLSALSYAAASAAFGILIILEWPYYQVPAESWSEQKYGGIFLESDRLAKRIDSLLPPGASFYDWGDESGLYFESRRSPPSGIVFAGPTTGGPMAAKLSQRLFDDLERSKPDLIVTDHWMLAQEADNPVYNRLQKDYRPFFKTNKFWIKRNRPPFFVPDVFVVFARKGSPLAAMAE